jgi:hypothetical protein
VIDIMHQLLGTNILHVFVIVLAINVDAIQAQMLKIIILDEKKRKGVLNMAAAVYALSTIIRYVH